MDAPLAGTQFIHGWAVLPTGQRIVCLAIVLREDSGDRYDWLDVCLPIGALSRVEPRASHLVPGDEANQSWREPIDIWLTDIAERVARSTTFRLALIGEEVSGSPAAELFTGTAPHERYVSFIVPNADGDGVTLHAANR